MELRVLLPDDNARTLIILMVGSGLHLRYTVSLLLSQNVLLVLLLVLLLLMMMAVIGLDTTSDASRTTSGQNGRERRLHCHAAAFQRVVAILRAAANPPEQEEKVTI
jgi:hypothetical protein